MLIPDENTDLPTTASQSLESGSGNTSVTPVSFSSASQTPAARRFIKTTQKSKTAPVCASRPLATSLRRPSGPAGRPGQLGSNGASTKPSEAPNACNDVMDADVAGTNDINLILNITHMMNASILATYLTFPRARVKLVLATAFGRDSTLNKSTKFSLKINGKPKGNSLTQPQVMERINEHYKCQLEIRLRHVIQIVLPDVIERFPSEGEEASRNNENLSEISTWITDRISEIENTTVKDFANKTSMEEYIATHRDWGILAVLSAKRLTKVIAFVDIYGILMTTNNLNNLIYLRFTI